MRHAFLLPLLSPGVILNISTILTLMQIAQPYGHARHKDVQVCDKDVCGRSWTHIAHFMDRA